MSNPRVLSDLAGTALTKFGLGLAAARAYLKAVSNGIVIRNAADSADAPLTASKVNVSGDGLTINSDAAETGADWAINVNRPTSGMTADWTLTLPPNAGSPSQVLQTNGSGVATWVTPSAGSPNGLYLDDTALAFGTSSPVAMFTKPAGAKSKRLTVYVDTAFNGTATMSVGITGSTSKYLGTGDVDLTTAGAYELDPGIDVTVGAEALIITYSAGGSTAGAARVEVEYGTPT